MNFYAKEDEFFRKNWLRMSRTRTVSQVPKTKRGEPSLAVSQNTNNLSFDNTNKTTV